MIDTAEMRRRKQLQPPGSSVWTYTRTTDVLVGRRNNRRRPMPARTRFTTARYALDSTVLPLSQDALPFAEQVRRAVIRNRSDTSHSEAITGKTADGVPLQN